MQYRPIGKTGMSASIIGLGMEHLDNKSYEITERHQSRNREIAIILAQ
jgi:aryl-alcohol dehydrogenase-like predicted oxidoreductase